MSVASLVAAQRTEHDVPHAVSCRALDLSESWLYKWLSRGPSDQELRRRCLDEAVKASFDDSGGTPGTYGSPRVLADLIEAGWRVSGTRWLLRWPAKAWLPAAPSVNAAR